MSNPLTREHTLNSIVDECSYWNAAFFVKVEKLHFLKESYLFSNFSISSLQEVSIYSLSCSR